MLMFSSSRSYSSLVIVFLGGNWPIFMNWDMSPVLLVVIEYLVASVCSVLCSASMKVLFSCSLNSSYLACLFCSLKLSLCLSMFMDGPFGWPGPNESMLGMVTRVDVLVFLLFLHVLVGGPDHLTCDATVELILEEGSYS